MALSKIQTGLVDTNAIGSTELNLADNFAFSGNLTQTARPMFSAFGNNSNWITPTLAGAWYSFVGGTAHSNGSTSLVDRYIGVDLTSDLTSNGSPTNYTWRQQGGHLNVANRTSDANSGKFTAPVAGHYLFSTSLYVNKLSNNTSAYFHVNGVINGTIQGDYTSYGYFITAGHYPDGVTKTQIYYLNANDTFQFAYYTNVASSFQLYGRYFTFQGFLIG